MPLHNSDIAGYFRKTADLLEIKGENRFRVRAYRDAAQTIESLSENVTEMIDNNKDLSSLSGIGKDLAGKIKSIVENEKFELLEKLKKQIPIELSSLMNISGLGPKRVSKLYKRLNIKSFDDLKKAVEKNKIQELEGFGKKMQDQIEQTLKRYEKQGPQRMKFSQAEDIIKPLCEYLSKIKDVKQINIAGSFRRRKETVGDIDILAACKKGSDIMDKFTTYDEVTQVIAKGTTKSSVLLRSGLQVDLRVMAQVSYGAAMLYFTGSKKHNIEIRKIANSKNYKINEYGVFKNDDRIAGKTEKQVYEKIKLNWIPPELRENNGEIKAAKGKNKLPSLIEIEDIKGDLHCHTKKTDGRCTIKELARLAKERDYKYIAITDHSKKVSVANGLTEEQLRKQIDMIDKINDELSDITILKGIEVDILQDGSLDLSNDVLKHLDLTVCSVHSKFNLSEKQQTERIIKAMENPYFTILGHPTGRMINTRPPYQVDIEKIINHAGKRNVYLEINAQPDRLDLNDIHAKAAKQNNVKMVISTDTHHKSDFDNIKYGIYQARRGWLEKSDVINTRSTAQLKKLLAKNRSK